MTVEQDQRILVPGNAKPAEVHLHVRAAAIVTNHDANLASQQAWERSFAAASNIFARNYGHPDGLIPGLFLEPRSRHYNFLTDDVAIFLSARHAGSPHPPHQQ